MELSELGSHPISAEHPAGADVRGGPDFEALQGEIDRVNDAANPGQPDWPKVVSLATTILSTQGKDLLVASYLAVGLMKQRPVEGFAQGLRLLRDTCIGHWDGMFPPLTRLRGRRNALQYWLDAIDVLLRDVTTDPLEQEAVDAMKACVDDLDALLREKDPEAPGIFRLSSIVNGFPVRVDVSPEAEAAQAATAAAETAAADAERVIETAEDAQATLETGFAQLRRAADFLSVNDPTDPISYRISRWIAWSRVAGIPADEGGTTIVPPPDTNYVEMLAAVEGAGDATASLGFAETQFANYPLWLDLQRCAALALQALGPEYAACALAVRQECSLFAARVNAAALKFSDGMPLASPATQQWLAEAGAGASAGGGGNAQPALSRELADAMKRAAELAGNGDILGAATVLQRGIGKAPNAKERFQGRVRLAELLVRAQSLANPWPFVQPLFEDIERHRIEEWDPVLAVSVLRLVYLAVSAAGEMAPSSPTTNDLLKRIALLDYAEALRLTGMQ